MSTKRDIPDWYPLESSPEVLTSLARHWGLPDQYSFIDVLGVDDQMLALVDKPVHAVVFLFPDTASIGKMRSKDPSAPSGVGDEPLWIPQVGVGHSCGTFAVLHALAETHFAPLLEPFYTACRAVPAVDRSQLVASSTLIKSAHDACVTAGQVAIRPTDWDDCDHFISFVSHDRRLYEMDGNKPRTGPVDRGMCTDVLKDTARVVKEMYLPLAEGKLNFSLIALIG